MLGDIFKKDPSEKIKKDMQKKRDRIIHQAACLRKLVNDENSGWREYVSLLEDYVQACAIRKAVTSLDTASDKTVDQLKLLDHEVWLIRNFILKIPDQIFSQERDIEEDNKQEALNG